MLLTPLLSLFLLASPIQDGPRVPGAEWLRYAEPREAGFDPELLEAAHERWKGLPSSAFMVVAQGAVVAAWGDVDRRFMCHSVRKSFLAALYGIYWDRGAIELNKTLADLGLDDEPDPLLPSEKQARILDLLKARSGVFHPAAYAGRTDSRPRGSEGPGRFFAYNNWDFNTLAAILRQETGADVFEAFDEHFGRPLGMQDWRVSDGYYHYELDKSKYPAYPFRLSARDAARFGLLYARDGMWGDRRILSRHWVRRCTSLYSIDTDVMGYGLMWWIYREPRFERHGMVSALGVGQQMIAALPDSDLVIVNRANTYDGESTPFGPLLDLVEEILAARVGTPVTAPRLVPLERSPADPYVTHVPAEALREFVGTWSYPPPGLEGSQEATIEVAAADGHLVARFPFAGTFALYLQPEGTLRSEDSREGLVAVRDGEGRLLGLVDAGSVLESARAAARAGDAGRARERLELVSAFQDVGTRVDDALVRAQLGEVEEAEATVRACVARSPAEVEARVNAAGYRLMNGGQVEAALVVFELNTRLFPEAFNAWDSLGEACLRAGLAEQAVEHYRHSLELNADNANAREQLDRIQARAR